MRHNAVRTASAADANRSSAPPSPTPLNKAHRAFDLAGAALSLGCALHCITLPLLLAFLPSAMLALRSFQHPAHGAMTLLLTLSRWEWLFALAASLFALASASAGARRHQDRVVLVYASAGALLLVASSSLPLLREALLWHGVLAALGGTLLASAHLRNRAKLRSVSHRSSRFRATP